MARFENDGADTAEAYCVLVNYSKKFKKCCARTFPRRIQKEPSLVLAHSALQLSQNPLNTLLTWLLERQTLRSDIAVNWTHLHGVGLRCLFVLSQVEH